MQPVALHNERGSLPKTLPTRLILGVRSAETRYALARDGDAQKAALRANIPFAGPCVSRLIELGSPPFKMASAIIKTGGKQYSVSEGDVLRVAKLAGNPGENVAFEEVLMVGGDQPKFGKPTVSGAKVEGQIVSHGRGEKLIVFKFKRRKKYHRKNGHRQDYTEVKITGITA